MGYIYTYIFIFIPISHTSTQYIDFVDFFIFHWICLSSVLLMLVGVELPLCVIVTIPGQNVVLCFLESS